VGKHLNAEENFALAA